MGTLSLPEKHNNNKIIAFNRKMVLEELVEGRRFAQTLRVLLQRPFDGDGSSEFKAEVAAEELVVKILRSFTNSLSLLYGGGAGETVASAGQMQEVCYDDSMVSGGRRLEDSGESKKRLPGPKGRRGCYKRKKNSETWRTVTATIEDGHAWRKYGQKDILNSTHPRSYFRCTHKYDLGCKATKQVQRMEDNPQMYEIIYIGNHTCRNHVITFTPPQMIITDNNGAWTSSATSASVLSSSSTPSTVVVKPEYDVKEETQSTTGDDLSENLSSSHHCHHDAEQLEYSAMWEDLVPLEADVVASSTVYSCNDTDNHHQNHQHILATTTTAASHDLKTDFEPELCFDASDFFLVSS